MMADLISHPQNFSPPKGRDIWGFGTTHPQPLVFWIVHPRMWSVHRKHGCEIRSAIIVSLFYIREKILGEISSRMQNKLTMMADLILHPRNFSKKMDADVK